MDDALGPRPGDERSAAVPDSARAWSAAHLGPVGEAPTGADPGAIAGPDTETDRAVYC